MSLPAIYLVLREQRRVQAARDRRLLALLHPAKVEELAAALDREAEGGGG